MYKKSGRVTVATPELSRQLEVKMEAQRPGRPKNNKAEIEHHEIVHFWCQDVRQGLDGVVVTPGARAPDRADMDPTSSCKFARMAVCGWWGRG